ncbi:(2Fe-2S)-binding protein [Kitasatospora sp. NPDC089913]|uniref:(2Fe-2S)-binding protein n=1 Tax=Streptomycetaceae TaxID=2062 RepID=UPI00087C4E98|nr:(2Fe-2S)-binding protein [Streptomyces sp. TLI_053]SDT20866.1 FhuF 2Fe-2S C-terminal domain-containing protein [Streptomyces sp. TLI_053]
MSVASGLDRLTAVGPYFALDTAGAPGEAPPPGFRPLRDLYAPGREGLLAGRIRDVGRRLGTAEARVAASILHLGLAARFCSVGLGAAVLVGDVPDLTPDEAWVRVPEQGPIDLWAPYRPTSTAGPGSAQARTSADPGRLADRLRRAVVEGQLAELATAVRSTVPLSDGLLRGNVASALAGALRVLDAHIAQAAPDSLSVDPGLARTLVARVLDRPPLAGTGTLTVGGARAGTGFRRTSCCLYYRVGPQAGVCGDCCFTSPPRRS